MSLTIDLLNSNLDFFPGKLGAVSKEQGASSHQDFEVMARRYQGILI